MPCQDHFLFVNFRVGTRKTELKEVTQFRMFVFPSCVMKDGSVTKSSAICLLLGSKERAIQKFIRVLHAS